MRPILPLREKTYGMVMKKYDIIGAMEVDVKSAVAEIESTTDLLERALKLSTERLAALPDFGVLAELRALKEEVSRG